MARHRMSAVDYDEARNAFAKRSRGPGFFLGLGEVKEICWSDARNVSGRPNCDAKMLGESARVERVSGRKPQVSPIAASCVLAPSLESAWKGRHLLGSHLLLFGHAACAARIIRARAAAVSGVAVFSRRK